MPKDNDSISIDESCFIGFSVICRGNYYRNMLCAVLNSPFSRSVSCFDSLFALEMCIPYHRVW